MRSPRASVVDETWPAGALRLSTELGSRRSRFTSCKDGVQSLPPDELHGVVVETVVLANPVDRNDMGVVQPGGGAGLAPEPFQPGRVGEMVERERLQAHMPAQRFLDRLVTVPIPPEPTRRSKR